jgi:hypothetical protein
MTINRGNVMAKGKMGHRKHRTSGVAPKSPKLRHQLKLEAEQNERKAPPLTCTHDDIQT